ncbi:pleckstrin (PH) domain-containing protein [Tieghemostelium lacteum]|uniref:Pleckstrin (PH) domain-containing protein n=1 Tax=Tieghemostelium lacteum TaxID=361077 RepID=A0A152A4K5_TIELA|nr:pleckstrin (PH) domain-containing protein [Tieghemostelium lacteum]|eukprot:KYR01172.1 pleckstrin (PH) domain-containing protein [Tieghemostelium lacteum]
MGNSQSNGIAEDPKLKKQRELILEEIIQTERTYVNYLSVVLEVFMEPMIAKSLIKEVDQKQLFINIETLAEFHQQFFRELALTYNSFNWVTEVPPITPTTIKTTVGTTKAHRKTTIVTTTTMLSQSVQRHDITSLESTREITEIFNNNQENFKMYSTYIIGYDSAVTTLNRLKKKSAVNQFLQKQQTDQRCNGLDLASMLIMPVQRLPRYVLLLNELLKTCPSDNHMISKLLSRCIQVIKDTTIFINEAKRDDENFNRVLLLQDTLVDKVQLAEPHRKLYIDGECTLHSVFPCKMEDEILKKIRRARAASKPQDREKFSESFVFPPQYRVESQTISYYLFNDSIVFLYQKPQKSTFSISKRIWSISNVSITEKLKLIDVLDIFTFKNSLLVTTEKSIYFLIMKSQMDKEKFIKIFQMSKVDWGSKEDHKMYNNNNNSTIITNNDLPSVLTLRFRDDSFLQTIDINSNDTTSNNNNNNISNGSGTITSKSSFFSLSSSTKETTTTTVPEHKRKQSVSVSSSKKVDTGTTSKGKSKSMFFNSLSSK